MGNLKTCPFCGRQNPRLFAINQMWFVQCERCAARVQSTDKDKAVSVWNMRTNEQKECKECGSDLTFCHGCGKEMDA